MEGFVSKNNQLPTKTHEEWKDNSIVPQSTARLSLFSFFFSFFFFASNFAIIIIPYVSVIHEVEIKFSIIGEGHMSLD